MEKIYYCYIFLDLRKPGFYSYIANGMGWCFTHEPFYIGKGTEKRCTDHFYPHKLKKNTPFYNKLNSILRENPSLTEKGSEPFIIVTHGIRDEQKAYDLETALITAIGSIYIDEIKDGPLTNMNLEQRVISRKNTPKGESHCHSKFTEKDIYDILTRLSQKESCESIGKDYLHISKYAENVVTNVKAGRNWKVTRDKFLSENPDASFCFNRSRFSIKEQKEIIKDVISTKDKKVVMDKWGINYHHYYRIFRKQTLRQAWSELDGVPLEEKS